MSSCGEASLSTSSSWPRGSVSDWCRSAPYPFILSEVRRVPLKETLATSLWVLWRASDRAAEARWAGIRAALVRSATARAL